MKEIPVIDVEATGTKIRQLREAAGLSIRDLQEKMCLAAPQSIYRWEYGRVLPSVDNLVILADVLGCSLDDIIITKRVPLEMYRTYRS